MGVRVSHLFRFFYVVLRYYVFLRSVFRVTISALKTMFGSFLHMTVVCRWDHVLFTLFAYCLGTGVRASGEFTHTYCTCQNCKIIGKVQMETTDMWGLTLIILKDIKCFQIWAYFEGIGINFNFENFQNKIFPLLILRTIQSMHGRYHRTLQHLSKIEGWFVYISFSLKC